MAKICNECGCPLNGNEDKCPECGCQTLQNQSNYKGDNEAEEILRKALDYFRKLIIVLAFIGSGIIFLGSIALDINVNADIPIFWLLGLIVAALNIIVWIRLAKLMWAVGMIFVNISTNIRIIKKSLATPK
ncbi:MAG: hypothetical protein J1E63_01465 [Muribaculaceae bacterium]|nr:hypothetical protein [Muribaculaceae bacterium]